MREGILIGADQRAEELIPWWWKNYSEHNSKPVSIVDFGMTDGARAWCQTVMDVIPFNHVMDWVKNQNEIQQENVQSWKMQYRNGASSLTSLWKSRSAWFKKPAACLLTPYDLTLWIDVDCEVCGSLDGLFDLRERRFDLAIVREDFHEEWRPLYNSGVMLFRKNAPFLSQWHERCKIKNATLMGDQDVLTELIVEGDVEVVEIPPIYNWLMYAGYRPDIVIAHWASDWGKEYIKKFGGMRALLS